MRFLSLIELQFSLLQLSQLSPLSLLQSVRLQSPDNLPPPIWCTVHRGHLSFRPTRHTHYCTCRLSSSRCFITYRELTHETPLQNTPGTPSCRLRHDFGPSLVVSTAGCHFRRHYLACHASLATFPFDSLILPSRYMPCRAALIALDPRIILVAHIATLEKRQSSSVEAYPYPAIH